jgi:hypothetical protein
LYICFATDLADNWKKLLGADKAVIEPKGDGFLVRSPSRDFSGGPRTKAENRDRPVSARTSLRLRQSMFSPAVNGYFKYTLLHRQGVGGGRTC